MSRTPPLRRFVESKVLLLFLILNQLEKFIPAEILGTLRDQIRKGPRQTDEHPVVDRTAVARPLGGEEPALRIDQRNIEASSCNWMS